MEQDTRALIVVTSHDQLGDTGRKTGFYFEELAVPYWALVDAGIAVDIASIISDSGVKSAPDNQTGIIVVRLSDGAMRRVLSNHPSTKNNREVQLTTAGEVVFPDQPLQVGINGTAASRDGQ